MASSFSAGRAQLIMVLCLPIAVLLGYLLSDPLDPGSMLLVISVLGLLSMPLLMHSYHALLIFVWNAAITPYFLPGQPFVWMIFSFIGFGFAIFNRLTNRDADFVSTPTVTTPLVFLAGVIVLTALLNGGIGIRSLGSEQYGGKGYFYSLAAILGYFALTSKRLPKDRAILYVAIFFLSGLTSLIPNIAYLLGPKFEFLFYLFPASYAEEQAMGDFSLGSTFGRVFGLTVGSNALYCWLLARYGLRGIFDVTKPLRLLLFAAATVGCLFCGYRGFMLLFLLTVGIQFFTERLFTLRNSIIGVLVALFLGALLLPNIDRMPFVVQRTLSFLPVSVAPSVRASAEGSTEWRLDMWLDVLPEVPKYLLKGKGYNIDPNELAMALETSRRGFLGRTYAWAIATGAYHNGPLTLIIPFGIFGFGAFVWFAIGSTKYLYRQYKYGDPDFKNVNTFLLAYFIARLVYYTFAFGNFYTDFFIFTGLIGVSISVNGALTQSQQVTDTEIAAAELVAEPQR